MSMNALAPSSNNWPPGSVRSSAPVRKYEQALAPERLAPELLDTMDHFEAYIEGPDGARQPWVGQDFCKEVFGKQGYALCLSGLPGVGLGSAVIKLAMQGENIVAKTGDKTLPVPVMVARDGSTDLAFSVAPDCMVAVQTTEGRLQVDYSNRSHPGQSSSWTMGLNTTGRPVDGKLELTTYTAEGGIKSREALVVDDKGLSVLEMITTESGGGLASNALFMNDGQIYSTATYPTSNAPLQANVTDQPTAHDQIRRIAEDLQTWLIVK